MLVCSFKVKANFVYKSKTVDPIIFTRLYSEIESYNNYVFDLEYISSDSLDEYIDGDWVRNYPSEMEYIEYKFLRSYDDNISCLLLRFSSAKTAKLIFTQIQKQELRILGVKDFNKLTSHPISISNENVIINNKKYLISSIVGDNMINSRKKEDVKFNKDKDGNKYVEIELGSSRGADKVRITEINEEFILTYYDIGDAFLGQKPAMKNLRKNDTLMFIFKNGDTLSLLMNGTISKMQNGSATKFQTISKKLDIVELTHLVNQTIVKIQFKTLKIAFREHESITRKVKRQYRKNTFLGAGKYPSSKYFSRSLINLFYYSPN